MIYPEKNYINCTGYNMYTTHTCTLEFYGYGRDQNVEKPNKSKILEHKNRKGQKQNIGQFCWVVCASLNFIFNEVPI